MKQVSFLSESCELHSFPCSSFNFFHSFAACYVIFIITIIIIYYFYLKH